MLTIYITCIAGKKITSYPIPLEAPSMDPTTYSDMKAITIVIRNNQISEPFRPRICAYLLSSM
jgi:hypothetical protein